MSGSLPDDSTTAALEAMRRGFQAVPIRTGGKKPYGSGWTHFRWESEELVKTSFDQWRKDGAPGVGLLLGAGSGGLIDVDLDHPRALRMRDYFLPPSAMQSGRPGNRLSHRWYKVTGDLPATRRYKMPDGSVSVELRSDGSQTVIPPSTWFPKPWNGDMRTTEKYIWEGEPFGGEEGPAEVDGRKLSIQVALLGLGSVLLDAWPKSGGRHDTYLALAGGLLRFGEGVHPYWEKNLPVLIAAMADATGDEDGARARISEVMGTTLTKLRAGDKAVGFPRLAELIGVDHAEQARRMAREVESLSGFKPEETQISETVSPPPREGESEEIPSTLPPEVRNPLEERITTWDQVDLEPYLTGQLVMPEPSVLQRTDGRGLLYPGRVNSIFGLSESAKSWIALYACVQEMGKGERVVFLDLEDEPAGTLQRVRALGAGDDDIKNQFIYLHPETAIAEMQKGRYGSNSTPDGVSSSNALWAMLDRVDPTLIVADGMTVLYGLHGLDTNDAAGTDVITTWLKSLTRAGRTTVVVIDHTGKTGGSGAAPIGAHHKIAMVQGTALRADAIDRPMPGAVGKINLIVYKDRPGTVRSISSSDTEQVAAEIVMDSTEEGVTKMTIHPPEEGNVVIGNSPDMEKKLEELSAAETTIEAILYLFGGDLEKTLTTTEVVDELDIPKEQVYSAWHLMKQRKMVLQEGTTRYTRFRLGPALTDIEIDTETGERSGWNRPRSDRLDDYTP